MNILTLEEPRALERAISAIQHGEVIAFPTDTVYGIGASLQHPDALDRIFELKGRDRERTLPVLLASIDDVTTVAPEPDPDLLNLARVFWPGPLTVAMPALDTLPAPVVAEDGTVGVRVPNHSIALILARRSGGAIATTSANLSGQAPARRPDEIDPGLADNLDLILDGGIAGGSLASTVVRRDGATICVVREGAISTAAVEAAWARVLSGQSPEIDMGTSPTAANAR